ncbi:MAG: lysoplasmalogenase [Clostridium sp.]|nr:lysoplasmalogenase [Clostridium sp.]
MNIFFFLLVFILSPITISLDLSYSDYYLYFKALSSLCFLLCGVFSFTKSKSKKKYPIFILLGLLCSLMGDIVIHPSSIPNYFIIGVLFFAIAHIFFIIGFVTICKIKLRNILLFIATYSLFIFLIRKYNNIFDFGDIFPFIAIYSALIIFMIVKSLDLFKYFKYNKFYTLFSILGPILFIISDTVLLFNVFSIYSSPILNLLNHITYFPGQALLALSLSKDITVK